MPTPVPSKTSIIGIAVRLELNSKDGLRQVIFTLSKDTLPNAVVKWKIGFQLFEKEQKTDPAFIKLIDLTVDVSTQNEAKAAALEQAKQLSAKAAAHALGTAADLAAAGATDPTLIDVAKEAAEETLAQD